MVSKNILTTSHGQIEFQLNRSAIRKKTMQIVIRPPDNVVVFAPAHYSQEQVMCFIRNKSSWIINKLNFFENLTLSDSTKVNNEPNCFYLGREYPVVHLKTDALWGNIAFDQEKFAVYVPASVSDQERPVYVENFLLKWFKSRAAMFLKERTHLYAKKIGVEPSLIQIRSPRSLWGSCHPIKRILHFNWKILMMPLDTLDYIVVHELCHMKVPNHSKRFWNLVMQYVVDFKRHHEWLKVNGHRLVLPS